jgi:hypothetical protein
MSSLIDLLVDNVAFIEATNLKDVDKETVRSSGFVLKVQFISYMRFRCFMFSNRKISQARSLPFHYLIMVARALSINRVLQRNKPTVPP